MSKKDEAQLRACPGFILPFLHGIRWVSAKAESLGKPRRLWFRSRFKGVCLDHAFQLMRQCCVEKAAQGGAPMRQSPGMSHFDGVKQRFGSWSPST